MTSETLTVTLPTNSQFEVQLTPDWTMYVLTLGQESSKKQVCSAVLDIWQSETRLKSKLRKTNPQVSSFESCCDCDLVLLNAYPTSELKPVETPTSVYSYITTCDPQLSYRGSAVMRARTCKIRSCSCERKVPRGTVAQIKRQHD